VKGFMGHTIDLDASYLRMTDEELKEQWLKAADRMSFLSAITNGSTKSRLEQLELENQRLQVQVDELSIFLRHMSSHWQPIEAAKKKEQVVLKPDFASMGLKWPLDEPKQPKRKA